MIGVGNFCFRRDGRIELHRVSAYMLIEMAMASEQIGTPKTDQQKCDIALRYGAANWKPDEIIAEDELLAIQKSNCSIPGKPDYHRLAADWTVVCDWAE